MMENTESDFVGDPESVTIADTAKAARPQRGSNRTTGLVLRVLSAFLEGPETGYRVKDLRTKLGIPKQTTVRALQTLEQEGYVIRRANGIGYELGYRIIELGSFDQVEPDLLEVATSTVQRVHALTGETVSLAARLGDCTQLLDYIDGNWPLTGRLRKGQAMMLSIGPVSRTVLAFLSDSEIQDFIARNTPLPATTSNAITDPETIWEEIQVTRARGYGTGLVLPGVYAIGLPIFGADNRPHGAIAIIGLTEDITGPRVLANLDEILKLLNKLNEQTRLFHADPRIEIGL